MSRLPRTTPSRSFRHRADREVGRLRWTGGRPPADGPAGAHGHGSAPTRCHRGHRWRRAGQRPRPHWVSQPPPDPADPSRRPRPVRPGRPRLLRQGTDHPLRKASGSDQGTGPERRIKLVTAEGEEVCAGGKGAVRCQLSRIDHHPHAPLVCDLDDLVKRRQPTRDIGRSRDGQQGRPGLAVERGSHVVHGEGPARRALDVAALGHTSPGQQVGVMFDDRRDHHVGGLETQTVGQMVDGLRRVAAKDCDVGTVGLPAGEGQDGLASALVGGSGPSRAETRLRGARSSTRGGRHRLGPGRRDGPGSKRPGRAPRPAARYRRRTEPAVPTRPGGPARRRRRQRGCRYLGSPWAHPTRNQGERRVRSPWCRQTARWRRAKPLRAARRPETRRPEPRRSETRRSETRRPWARRSEHSSLVRREYRSVEGWPFRLSTIHPPPKRPSRLWIVSSMRWNTL